MTPKASKSEGRLSAAELLDLYFLSARRDLIEIAAFLDRLARSSSGSPDGEDFRLEAFRKALEALTSEEPEKAKAVQLAFSDPTTEPLKSAAGMKGACGAYVSKASRYHWVR